MPLRFKSCIEKGLLRKIPAAEDNAGNHEKMINEGLTPLSFNSTNGLSLQIFTDKGKVTSATSSLQPAFISSRELEDAFI
jgi:hypothetical protein